MKPTPASPKPPKSVIVSIYEDGGTGCVWDSMRQAKKYSDAPHQLRYYLPSTSPSTSSSRLRDAIVKAAMAVAATKGRTHGWGHAINELARLQTLCDLYRRKNRRDK